ncbi:hypothetical protein PRZ48_006159 [Zasmidium cellare]|uniref:Peptidase S53 domain-containing protein n=1 Tax=Zasmidium cellare TaxID=395010 RepID=A0ABR0EPJ8_ZASCE|nr:hypothetical protein PRZ48_006159 [Zasmidium cellare]
MLWFHTLTAVAFAATASAAPRVVHERRHVPLKSYASERVAPEAIIPIRIGLKQSNLESGYDRLMEVSHPTSSNYGKHLSAQEVHDLFAPANETLEAVLSWLADAGVNKNNVVHYENKGWLAIDMPAETVERLLSTEYYEHTFSDDIRIGCDQYYLPAHISPHVDFIKPGVKLSPPVKKRTVEARGFGRGRGGHWPPGPPHVGPNPFPHWRPPPGAGHLPKDLQNCSALVTPNCLKALYNIPQAKYSDPSNVMGIFETSDAFSVQDLQLYFQKFVPYIPQGTSPTVNSVDGGVAPVAPDDARNGGESDLDIDLAYAIVYPQKVTVYQVDDPPNSGGQYGKAGFLNTFFDSIDGSYCNYTAYGITGDSPDIDATYPDPASDGYKGQCQCGTYQLTRVVSISYGEAEIDLPKAYVERQCNEIMKLGLQGHSILVASGDYGVASFPGADNDTYGCYSANGQKGTIYNPDYPAGCPFVTSVGGTRLYEGQTIEDPESAMQVNLTAVHISEGRPPGNPVLALFATGGGFSNYFKPPSYQARAVSQYLAAHAPDVPSYTVNSDASNVGANGGVYNRAGRGYPDVSANGAFQPFFVNLTQETYFGTSLSSPIFGSIITLINEERTAAGKGPVGFVNPVLYQHPEVLHDITNGSNPNCGSSGFSASTGWDPVTGLGTPNYPAMLRLFLSLP